MSIFYHECASHNLSVYFFAHSVLHPRAASCLRSKKKKIKCVHKCLWGTRRKGKIKFIV
jgi:hypothetical protein